MTGLLLSFGTTAGERRNVWIDADPACGFGMTDDVDDCWAIIAALRSSSLNIAGISTVFGNIRLAKVKVATAQLMDAVRTHEPALMLPPVFMGASRPVRKYPAMSGGVVELERALEKKSMDILALGPLTNIALLLKKRPDLVHRINSIIAVAGQRPDEDFKIGRTPLLHFHDMNFRMDVEAFDIVLRSGVSLYLIPFEVGRQFSVTRSDLEKLKYQGGLDKWLGNKSLGWMSFWNDTLGAEGFSPFDFVATVWMLNHNTLDCEVVSAEIVRRKGLFVVRDTLEIGPVNENENVVTWCPSVNRSFWSTGVGLLDFLRGKNRKTQFAAPS